MAAVLSDVVTDVVGAAEKLRADDRLVTSAEQQLNDLEALRETLERILVELARLCAPEDIASFVDALLDALGIDKASDVRRERRLAERGVDLQPTWDGMRALHGTLTPEGGADVAEALAQASRPSGEDDDRTPRQRQHDA